MSRTLRLKNEAELRALLDRRRPRPTATTAGAPQPESLLERRFAQQLDEHTVTAGYVREYWALANRDFRLDFAWPARKIAVEIQGQAHRIKGKFAADIEKRNLCIIAGWKVLELDGKAVRSGQGIEWLKELLTTTRV